MPKLFCTAALLCLVLTAPVADAVEIHVDRADPACSDAGPGSAAMPYCTISAAVDQHQDPGTTFLVHAGHYPEQVIMPASGDSIEPIVLQAVGEVIVDGADDFSDPAEWSHYDKQVWRASAVDWPPHQVFMDDARLALSGASKGSLQPGEFLYVGGEGLYVNAGGGGAQGDNPGSHDLRVGRRDHGFRMTDKSWITIDGFTILRTENRAIYVQENLRGVSIVDNTVRHAGHAGIAVVEAAKVLIARNTVVDCADHGIAFVSGVSGSTIEDNLSYGNARPGTRAANGIYLFASVDNLIQRNRLHDNQDTGLQLARDADDNVSLQNVSWSNGDHGFDCVDATGTVQIGNVAWGNERDGFSLEGGATGTTFINCIATENGVTTDRFDLFVDPASAPGMVSDHNVFWNATGQDPIKVDNVRYQTIAAFTLATGHDASSIQEDPLFVSPAAGDFYLQPGSPAIDSGDSSPPLWPATDADGLLRFDDPLHANLGTGPVPHTDRGAHEFFTQALAVGDEPDRGAGVALSNAYPNPSVAGIALTLELPHAARVEWSIHDVQGRNVRRHVESRSAGRSLLRWNGRTTSGARVRPGLYFVHVFTEGAHLTRSITILR